MKSPAYPKQSEASFQRQVILTARTLGWLCHHVRASFDHGKFRTALQGDAGFPDLVLCHEKTGDLIFAELKAEKGKLSPAQERWGAALQKSGLSYYVWKPSDWTEIESRLKNPRKKAPEFHWADLG